MIDVSVREQTGNQLLCSHGEIDIVAKLTGAGDDPNLQPGQGVTLAIQPEKIRICEPGNGTLDGIVQDTRLDLFYHDIR